MIAIKEEVNIGNIRLLRGDCLEIMPELIAEGLQADLISDVPYGINLDTSWLSSLHIKCGKPANKSDNKIVGDDKKFDVEPFQIFKNRTIFGHPYVYDDKATGWLVWDKQPKISATRTIGNPCEMASSTVWSGFHLLKAMWAGYMRCDGEVRYEHPTQKPIRVMEWCINKHKNKNIIVDPFMGSGSTGVACVNLQRKFIGIEIEKEYFDIAVKRVTEASRQGRLDL